MTIHCTDCHGELDPAYFDTRCRDCDHPEHLHCNGKSLDGEVTHDGHCQVIMPDGAGLNYCACGEWRQKVLRCEQCERIAANQASYDNLTPWQQWRRQ